MLYKLSLLSSMSAKNIWYPLLHFKLAEILLFFIGILWTSEERKRATMKGSDEVDFVSEKPYHPRPNAG